MYSLVIIRVIHAIISVFFAGNVGLSCLAVVSNTFEGAPKRRFLRKQAA